MFLFLAAVIRIAWNTESESRFGLPAAIEQSVLLLLQLLYWACKAYSINTIWSLAQTFGGTPRIINAVNNTVPCTTQAAGEAAAYSNNVFFSQGLTEHLEILAYHSSTGSYHLAALLLRTENLHQNSKAINWMHPLHVVPEHMALSRMHGWSDHSAIYWTGHRKSQKDSFNKDHLQMPVLHKNPAKINI